MNYIFFFKTTVLILEIFIEKYYELKLTEIRKLLAVFEQ